jgi:hypothetical protein
MTVKNKKLKQTQKENSKSTSLLFKGGNLIVQENSQKGIENTYFDFFIKSKIGKEWYDKNKIIKKIEDEKPDFIFEMSTGKTIGLEIINFIVKSDKYHEDKHKAIATLKTIGNKVCHYFKQKTGIALSLVIDIWDPRKWSSQWKDHIEHCYDPGFKHLNASDEKIKNAIIEALLQEPIPSFGIVKKSIPIGNQIFIITADRTCNPHTSVNINNAGICKEDPFEELQIIINNKNGKYETYKNKCDECDLLVVSDDSSTGNFVTFSDKINTHKFSSVFKNVYLLCFDSSANVIKLQTK